MCVSVLHRVPCYAMRVLHLVCVLQRVHLCNTVRDSMRVLHRPCDALCSCVMLHVCARYAVRVLHRGHSQNPCRTEIITFFCTDKHFSLLCVSFLSSPTYSCQPGLPALSCHIIPFSSFVYLQAYIVFSSNPQSPSTVPPVPSLTPRLVSLSLLTAPGHQPGIQPASLIVTVVIIPG